MFLKLVNIRKRYDGRNVLNKVSFTLGFGDKVGLIGNNGEGKTTLLKMIAGLDTPTSGEIVKDPESLTIFYHEQVIMKTEDSIKDFILSSIPNIKAVTKKLKKNFSVEGLSEYEALGGFNYENNIKRVLNILNLDKFTEDTQIKELSGGERTRLQLAPIIISKPNILLLDEPTNNLDIEGIEFIQKYINEYKGIVVIATHDRNLLENCTNRIIEIDKGSIFNIKGDYKIFRREKELVIQHAEEQFARNTHEIRKLEKNASKFNQAQSDIENKTKYKITDNDKMQFNYLTQKAERKFARKSELINKKIKEYKSNTQKPKEDWKIKVDLSKGLAPKTLFDIKSISKSYNKTKVISNFSKIIETNEKILVKGPNGSGKTTLLKMLAEELIPDSGIIEKNENTKVTYLSQDHLEIDVNKDLLQDFIDTFNVNNTTSRTYLHKYLFKEEEVYRKLSSFSQGEKAKYALAKALYKSPDFLILDEPTNYLDIQSKEIIEKALLEFNGGFIMATHDIALIKKIKWDEVINMYESRSV